MACHGRAWLLATALAGLPGALAAQPLTQGLYVSAGIGANMAQDAKVEPRGQAAPRFDNRSGEVSFDVRPMGTVALGYGFGNGIRVELEASLRFNGVDGASGFGPLQRITEAQGQLWQVGVMANAYVDMNVGLPWMQPYLGVGLGYVYSDWRDLRVSGPTTAGNLRLAVDAGDGNLAYQGIAGAAFPIESVPGLAVTTEYRFLGQVDPEFRARAINVATSQSTPGKVEINPYQHAVLIGLRYVPGVRPPPEPLAVAPMPLPQVPAPAPAAAPTPARTFVVYFGLGSAALNVRARELVAEAAQAARGGGATRIEVTGHTDSVGSAASNQRLSLQRAQAVAAELVRRGVGRDDITIRGAGETELAVATGPNVREPQNRRVEIVIR